MREVENAADRVLRAMRALDAHRQDAAPTLEREYRRALETYFVASEQAMGRDPARDDDADDREQDAGDACRADDLRRARAALDAHYAAARTALRLVRTYRREAGTSGRREREALEAVLRHRAAIRALRLRLQPPAEQLLLPGLAKTRPPEAAPRVATKTG